MGANTRYLVRLWGVVGLLAVLVLVQLGTSLAYGKTWVVAAPIAALAIWAFVRWRRGGRLDRLIRELLESDSPEPLVDFYQRTLRSGLIPDVDAFRAYSCAVAYILYGDYASARAAIQDIDWVRRPPLIRAAGLSVEALLCYFDTRDYVPGLNLAVTAEEAARVPGGFPGARTAAAHYESLVEIGQVLCGQATESTMTSLEQKLTELPTIGRVLVAWGLAVAHCQRGDSGRATAMQTYIRDIAPHCRALTLPDTSVPTEPSTTPDGDGRS